MVARGAHNPEVTGSNPVPANFLFLFYYFPFRSNLVSEVFTQ